MSVTKFSISDARWERAPEQDGYIFLANLVDQRDGGPVTVGYGRCAPNQTLNATLTHVEATIVLEGRVSAATESATTSAGPGEVIYMPKDETIVLRSHEEGAVFVYVTYPHWQETI